MISIAIIINILKHEKYTHCFISHKFYLLNAAISEETLWAQSLYLLAFTSPSPIREGCGVWMWSRSGVSGVRHGEGEYRGGAWPSIRDCVDRKKAVWQRGRDGQEVVWVQPSVRRDLLNALFRGYKILSFVMKHLNQCHRVIHSLCGLFRTYLTSCVASINKMYRSQMV